MIRTPHGGYADVIVDRSVAELDHPFTYSVPPELLDQVHVGSLVRVPLGRDSALGYVIELHSEVPAAAARFKIRHIEEVLSSAPLWGEDLMVLARWMRDFYGAYVSQCLQSVVPAPVRIEKRPKKGRKPRAQTPLEEARERPVLNPAQASAVSRVAELLQQDRASVCLLHGVTGSGKTEVYLHAIEEALKLGRQAVVLVPEISLTAQAIDRYQARFGDTVAVMHSGLTPAERLGEWWRIHRGEARIALGARSAVFAPMPSPGLFIVDEEQDTSYKQESPPRYNARQVAIKRAMDSRAVVLLGSATPSLESHHWAKEGRYHYLALPDRIGSQPMPAVQVVDMRNRDRSSRRYGMISIQLKERMDAVLAEGSQVLLFLNRRGFSSYLMCEQCGYIPHCIDCDITLTYHLTGVLLKCHYCTYEQKLPPACPKCGNEPFRHHGSGTQRVEEDLRRAFPDVPMVRMDRDTTNRRGAHRELLGEFASGKARILLGTQMIAKGLDFPQVRLAAVILADTALGLPDFRATERAFSLLTQVAGRSGRSEGGGEVIIQTYNPDHPAVVLACHHDYEGFFKWELENRRELHYPPFSHLVNVLFTGPDEGAVREAATVFAGAVKSELEEAGCALLGTAPCAIPRIQARYRWHLAARGPRVQEIVAVFRKHLGFRSPGSQVQASLDVDPVTML